LLSPLGALDDSHFFGGHAFKFRGKQFAVVMGNTLYFRVSDGSRPQYEAQGSLPFSYATRRGRVLVKTYYAVPPDVLEDRDALLRWAREASAAGLTPLVEGL
jgi:DNA transformation protein and related proteins